jgi:hypothetical protein
VLLHISLQEHPPLKKLRLGKWIILSDEQEWDPHSQGFQDQEENFIRRTQFGNHGEEPDRNLSEVISNTRPRANVDLSTQMVKISKVFDDRYLINIAATSSSNRECNQTVHKLAASWGIGIDTANKTLKCTTQKGMRHTLYPIERHFRTHQAQL